MISRQRMWKLESLVTSTIGVFIAEVLLRAVYRTIRKDKAPTAVFDPDNRQFSWPDAAVWAVAGGLGLALAKIGSARHRRPSAGSSPLALRRHRSNSKPRVERRGAGSRPVGAMPSVRWRGTMNRQSHVRRLRIGGVLRLSRPE